MNTFQVQNLSCARENRILFDDISFTLHAHDALLVEGPNGSGKSTLLRLLTGIATPANGEILWRGKLIHEQRANYFSDLHYIAHSNGIKLNLTVRENLQLTGCLQQTTYESLAILESLQLHAQQNTLAKNLSAGQKRKLALAKLFVFPKPLWILDEPFTALDTNAQAFFLAQLDTHLKHRGICILSSHHSLSLKNNLQILRLES